MPKAVVYTCLFGTREILREVPSEAYDDEVDFICFTDDPKLQSKTWNVRFVHPSGLGPARESRRPKLMPHLFLSEYDESIYIDNTVALKKQPRELLRHLAATKDNLICIKHFAHATILEEAKAIIQLKLDDEAIVTRQVANYLSWGFSGDGVVACTVLIRRHNAPDIVRFGESWFAHVVNFSRRDQLSFPYIAYRDTLRFSALDLDLRANEYFEWPFRNINNRSVFLWRIERLRAFIKQKWDKTRGRH